MPTRNLAQSCLSSAAIRGAVETFQARWARSKRWPRPSPANMRISKVCCSNRWPGLPTPQIGPAGSTCDHAIAQRQLQLLVPFLAQDTSGRRIPAEGDDRAHGARPASCSSAAIRRGASRHAAAAVSSGSNLVALEPSNAEWMGAAPAPNSATRTICCRQAGPKAAAAIRAGCDLVRPTPRPRPQRRRVAQHDGAASAAR